MIVQECKTLYVHVVSPAFWYHDSNILKGEKKRKKEKKNNNKSKQVGKRKKDGCRFLPLCFSQSLSKLVYMHAAYST